MKAIIVEAGQHTRSLDTSASQPKALDIEKNSNKMVLEWIISSLSHLQINEIIYIGSYHIEKVIKQFPLLNFLYYSPQEASNEVEALQLYKHQQQDQDDLIVIRADTVILPSALQFDAANLCLFYTTDKHKAEDLAFMFVPKAVCDRLFWLTKEKKLQNFHEIAEIADLLVMQKAIEMQAASISKPHLMSRVIFQGKGRTLENIAPLLKKAIVLDQIRFSYKEWCLAQENILNKIQAKYTGKVVVRSNTRLEDSTSASLAGAFLSLLDINANDRTCLKEAIAEVIASYSKNRVCLDNDEILIQAQVENIKASGVLFTREPRTGSPYFVLSLDSTSGRSDKVTAGTSEKIDNYYIAWHSNTSFESNVAKTIEVARELLSIAPIDCLDIEFCIDIHDKVYLLQVRPLILSLTSKFKDEEILNALQELSLQLKERLSTNPAYLSGNETVLGVMPDWNPAEIIGLAPKPLALSLYQALVCNKAWAKARSDLGYKETIEPLVFSIAGAPYVDVRTSINSLLGCKLSASVANKWSNWCVAQLKQKPYLHDKVEFEIYVTCLSPYWEKYKARLHTALQDDAEVSHFYQTIHLLTSHIFSDFENIIAKQQEKLFLLAQTQQYLLPLTLSQTCRGIRKLIEEVIANGVIPFAVLARMAFISMAYLRDFVDMGVMSETTKHQFLNAIPTIATKYHDDMCLYQKNKVSLEELISEYGHLRPNSYEITALNYATCPKQYFQAKENISKTQEQSPIDILLPYEQTISAILADLKLDISFSQLVKFICQSISLREYAKFQFMKIVNQILLLIENLGKHVGLTKDQLSFLHIDDLLRFETDMLSKATQRHLFKSVSFNQKKHALLCSYMLPELITSAQDVLGFKMGDWKPNFITLNKVIGEVIFLKEGEGALNLDNKIVCIEAADPGYDWIFSHRILGLITAFGGVASHMAIRAAEFNIPAAIGCGINKFNHLKMAARIALNCEEQSVKVIE
ncbi:MAG: hypothetical protein JSS07_06590 [Proteobacteria bacterium]|nr:hypothetical protein [Pseudomonadota bacterium]